MVTFFLKKMMILFLIGLIVLKDVQVFFFKKKICGTDYKPQMIKSYSYSKENNYLLPSPTIIQFIFGIGNLNYENICIGLKQ